MPRVIVDGGGLAYNDRDGYDLLLDWINRYVNLPLAWPSLHRDVVADAWRTNMIAYKTWYVPEWLLFLAIPVGALLLAIEFVLRFLRVQGVVRETYDITDRASI